MARFPDPAARRLWRQRLRRFEQCRLTIAAFCQAERVSVASFYYWRRTLRHDTPPRPTTTRQNNTATAKPAFLPVQVVRKPTATATIHVRFPNGVRLAVPADNHAALEAVLTTVGRLPSTPGREDKTC